jgi:hypothetical protein
VIDPIKEKWVGFSTIDPAKTNQNNTKIYTQKKLWKYPTNFFPLLELHNIYSLVQTVVINFCCLITEFSLEKNVTITGMAFHLYPLTIFYYQQSVSPVQQSSSYTWWSSSYMPQRKRRLRFWGSWRLCSLCYQPWT